MNWIEEREKRINMVFACCSNSGAKIFAWHLMLLWYCLHLRSVVLLYLQSLAMREQAGKVGTQVSEDSPPP